MDRRGYGKLVVESGPMKMPGAFYAQWFDEGPVEAPPASLVHGTLRWILKRLNDGLVQPLDGRPTTVLTIGRADAGRPLPPEFASEMQRRRVSVNLAGAFAEARERGVEPKHSDARLLIERLFAAPRHDDDHA